MRQQDNIKTKSGTFFSIFMKVGAIGLGLWLFVKSSAFILGIDDRFSSVEGAEAVKNIHEDIGIAIDTLKNANYAIYAKGGLPADPNMHMRFEVDLQILDAYIKNNRLKPVMVDAEGCISRGKYSSIGNWWQPSKIRSNVCFKWGIRSTDYTMTFETLNDKTARVYVFGDNN